MIKKLIIVIFFIFFINNLQAEENIMILKLKNGDVIIELYPDIAPNHVKRFKLLVGEKKYDGYNTLSIFFFNNKKRSYVT